MSVELMLQRGQDATSGVTWHVVMCADPLGRADNHLGPGDAGGFASYLRYEDRHRPARAERPAYALARHRGEGEDPVAGQLRALVDSVRPHLVVILRDGIRSGNSVLLSTNVPAQTLAALPRSALHPFLAAGPGTKPLRHGVWALPAPASDSTRISVLQYARQAHGSVCAEICVPLLRTRRDPMSHEEGLPAAARLYNASLTLGNLIAGVEKRLSRTPYGRAAQERLAELDALTTQHERLARATVRSYLAPVHAAAALARHLCTLADAPSDVAAIESCEHLLKEFHDRAQHELVPSAVPIDKTAERQLDVLHALTRLPALGLSGHQRPRLSRRRP
ncbi:hypothetical protein ACIP5N_21425 [Streptomyces sp. NPDC088768]|uniref:hypothetical protein n=1 Tax=Streptomyces sp. NPDC088768 TaxID=3365894 RepID=UPI00380B5FD1